MTDRRLLVAMPLAAAIFVVANGTHYFWINANWADYWPYGFPLYFYEIWGPCPPNEICHSFSLIRLLANVAIIYAFSVLSIGLIAAARKQLGE